MKATEILEAIGQPKNKYNNMHASRLAAVCQFLNKAAILKADIGQDVEIQFGRYTEMIWKLHDYQERIMNEGEKIKGAIIKVETTNGKYSFAVPTENKFFTYICNLVGIEIKEQAPAIKEKAEYRLLIPKEILPLFAKATKFVSNDDIRPSMMHVCLKIENFKAQIAATDAHRLYMSQKFNVSRKEKTEILISVEDCKKIAKLQPVGNFVDLQVLQDNRIMIDQLKCAILDAKFPEYEVVIPNYDTFIRLDRQALIRAIKQVLPSANQCTHQVNLVMNGKMELISNDVDFAIEAKAKIDYAEKTFQDSTIAFSGKFLLNCLDNFKDKEIKIYTAGSPTKAALISNDIETTLLMPLMLNN